MVSDSEGIQSRMFKGGVQRGRREQRGEAYFGPYVEPLSDARTKLAGLFNILSRLLEDDPGPGGFHLEDLQGIVDALSGMIQNQARVGDVGIEQLILSTAVIEIAVVDLTVLVDMIVQCQLGLAEGLPVDNNIVRLKSHSGQVGEL
jgi:hypothetical protein